MQADGINTYTWDGESQLKTAAGVAGSANYGYDGDGRRVSKVGTKLYWYGSGGEILAETDAAGNTLNAYVFFGGKRVALVPATGTPLYYAEDMLGSSRVIVQSNGTLCYDADFTPFGAEATATSTCAQNYKFEGKERDSESGNDDFGARYYSWRFGRWLSADWSSVPMAVPYANLTNPQTLNLYAMVADDPESFADLDGHDDGGGESGGGGGGVPGGDAYNSAAGQAQYASFHGDDAVAAAQVWRNAQAQQQNGTTTTPGDPSRLTQPNPDTVIPGSPSQQRERVYQATDKDGNPITTPGAQIMENAKVTKVTPGYAIDPQTSNGKWINANPGPGQFTDRLGPDSRDKTATYSYTTRQSFQIKIGDTVYPLSTVVRNQITVVGGVVTSIKTTFITP